MKKIFSIIVLLLMMTMSMSARQAYKIHIGENANGGITFTVNGAEVDMAEEGEVVTMTVTADPGWFITGVAGQWYASIAASRTIDMLKREVELVPVEGSPNTYTFTMERAEAQFNVTYKLEVVKTFEEIGEVVLTDESKAKIDDAREAYEALPDYLKAFVTEEEMKMLTDAEDAYDALKKAKEDADAAEQAAAEKAAADKAAADDVTAKIDAIGEGVLTDDSKALIDDAREAYDALTDDQKALIIAETLKVLTGAEDAYAALVKAKAYADAAAAAKAAADKAAADAVIAKINAIGDAGQDQEFYLKVAAARGAYDALPADQKALI